MSYKNGNIPLRYPYCIDSQDHTDPKYHPNTNLTISLTLTWP